MQTPTDTLASDFLFTFPAVKEGFIPDPGYTFVNIDLAGADARVVAWRANDEDLKNAFRSGVKIHYHNGCTIWGKEAMDNDPHKVKYTKAKKGVHASNYGAKTAARRCGMTNNEWVSFQRKWFSAHPAIVDWHAEVLTMLNVDGTIRNPFGSWITFPDRPNEALRNALAWEPSSTVAEVTFIAMREIDRSFNPQVELLLQVHDSLLLQIPTRTLSPTLRSLHDMLNNIIVPYPDPLVIPWELAISDQSWEHCKEISWNEAY